MTQDGQSSQTVKALLSLRDLILTGELKAGDRISELSVVERLGVSRTPIRMALVRLEEEGLLELIPSGGFAVKAFSERDITDAIEIRGTLEGLCARLAAERGLTQSALGELRDCVAAIDELVARDEVTEELFSAYVDLNERFHALLVDLRRLAPCWRASSSARSISRSPRPMPSCGCRPSCPKPAW